MRCGGEGGGRLLRDIYTTTLFLPTRSLAEVVWDSVVLVSREGTSTPYRKKGYCKERGSTSRGRQRNRTTTRPTKLYYCHPTIFLRRRSTKQGPISKRPTRSPIRHVLNNKRLPTLQPRNIGTPKDANTRSIQQLRQRPRKAKILLNGPLLRHNRPND